MNPIFVATVVPFLVSESSCPFDDGGDDRAFRGELEIGGKEENRERVYRLLLLVTLQMSI